MDVPLALVLATRANAFFSGAPGRMEVLAGHPTFARFNDLTFVRQTGLGGDVVADGSLPWFRRLRNEGVGHVRPVLTGLQMEKTSDGSWGLVTEGDRGLEIWSPNVVRRFQGHDDLQPYRLTMTSSRFDRWSLTTGASIEEASVALLLALGEVREGLEASGQVALAGAVRRFMVLHEERSTECAGDLFPIAPDLPVEALPLFASAARAYALIERTGWTASPETSIQTLAEPLWKATRDAIETAIIEICAGSSNKPEPIGKG